MADNGTERPRKRVTVLSGSSFWWRVIKDSLKHSREPFEHVSTYLAILAGAAVVFYLLHLLTQEWVDHMIYWTLALAFAVWAVWLVGGLIKMPWKIYKTDIAALAAGAEAVNDRKGGGVRNFFRVFLVTLIVGAFVTVFVAKNRQISELQSKLTLPKQAEPPKLLPDKTIANPTNPVPAQVVAASSPPIANSQPKEAKFETNEPTDGLSDIGAFLAKAKVEKSEKEEKDKLAAEEERQEDWKIGISNWRFALQSLYDVLKDAAAKRGDGITKTEGYFQCVEITPPSQSIDNTKLAEIRFQNQTNIAFLISLKNVNDQKALEISAECGTVQVYHFRRKMESTVEISRFDYQDNVKFNNGNEHDAINKHIKTLVSSQLYLVERGGK